MLSTTAVFSHWGVHHHSNSSTLPGKIQVASSLAATFSRSLFEEPDTNFDPFVQYRFPMIDSHLKTNSLRYFLKFVPILVPLLSYTILIFAWMGIPLRTQWNAMEWEWMGNVKVSNQYVFCIDSEYSSVAPFRANSNGTGKVWRHPLKTTFHVSYAYRSWILLFLDEVHSTIYCQSRGYFYRFLPVSTKLA
jgi:hypothetical protein